MSEIRYRYMKKYFVSIVLASLVVMTLGGCATSEERVARAAEQAAKVKAALAARNYKIVVERMNPMRGSSRSVSFGYSVEVKKDSLISYLPYLGRAYQVPYGGGKGLNFSESIGSYQESFMKNGKHHISHIIL